MHHASVCSGWQTGAAVAAAIMIADVVSDCERDDDGKWRFVSHRLMPVFEGGVPATIPQN